MLEILGGSSPQVESCQTTPSHLMSYSYGWSEDTGCRVALSIQSPRSDTIHGKVPKDDCGRPQDINYFEDHCDVALGLSTDGFTVHRFTFWPLIIFLYNLPPTI